MKRLFIILFICSISIGHGQTIYKYYLDLDNYTHAHTLTKVSGKMVYTGSNIIDKAFFDSYDIIEYYQPFPNGIDVAVLNTYYVETTSTTFIANLISKYSTIYIGSEDITTRIVEILDESNMDDCASNDSSSESLAELIDPAYDYLHVPDAWNIAPLGGSSAIKIGISDKAVRFTAPDFAGKITGTPNYVPNTIGYSHGNGVAALAAAAGNNGTGTAGVCKNCSIVATTIGIGSVTVNSNLYQLAVLGAKVVNMSWYTGTYYSSPTAGSPHEQMVINDIVNNYHVTLVAAAGNWTSYSTPTSYHPGSPNTRGMLYVFPASYDNVISVSTVTHFLPWTLPLSNVSSPSNPSYCCLNPVNNKHYHSLLQDSVSKDAIDSTDPYNPIAVARNYYYQDANNQDGLTWMHTLNEKVDLLSTGYSIYSYANELAGITTPTESGTSFSAPIVTGTIGLMLSVNDCLMPQEVETVLKLTTKDIENMPLNINFNGVVGAGKLEVFDAVSFVNEMKKSNGVAVIDNHIFNRYNYKLLRINNDLRIENVTFKENCNVDFLAKRQIVLKPGTFLKPGAGSHVYLKIDGTIDVCTSPSSRVTGVNSDSETKAMTIAKAYLSPNPNKGSFNVLLKNITEFQNTTIHVDVIDINGRVIYSSNATTDKSVVYNWSLNVISIPKGIYFVRLSANDHVETLKFVKN